MDIKREIKEEGLSDVELQNETVFSCARFAVDFRNDGCEVPNSSDSCENYSKTEIEKVFKVGNDTAKLQYVDCEIVTKTEVKEESLYLDKSIEIEFQPEAPFISNVLQKNEIKIEQSVQVMDEGNGGDTIVVDELQESPSVLISQPSSSSTSFTKYKNRKRDNSDNILDIIAHSLHSNMPSCSQIVGKFDSYGKHIARELKDLQPNMAIYCKKVINEAIYHAQLGNLTENSTVLTEVNPP